MSQSDRELLELAAKAAGIKIGGWIECEGYPSGFASDAHRQLWNPLTDDGDALRLAVRLQLTVEVSEFWANAWHWKNPSATACQELINQDEASAATRRAIVRAAAEIGSNM
jgi:hypothetical protein